MNFNQIIFTLSLVYLIITILPVIRIGKNLSTTNKALFYRFLLVQIFSYLITLTIAIMGIIERR